MDDKVVNLADKETKKLVRQTAAMLKRRANHFRKGKLVRSKVKTVNIKGGRSFRATEEKLRFSIRSKVYTKRLQLPERIRFNYAYHGFFVERGIGPGRRIPSAWLKPVMDKQLSKLGDLTSRHMADASVKAIF